MQTYLLIAIGDSAAQIDAAVQEKVAKPDSRQIESGKWLVSLPGVTSKDVADALGISDTSMFIITPIRGYFGRSRPDIWEWLAAKARPNVTV